MKKLYSILLILCLAVCAAVPALADDGTASGVGRQDILNNNQMSTAESAQFGDDMASNIGNSSDTIASGLDGVKNQWDSLTGGLGGVTKFLGECVGGSIAALPESFKLYLIVWGFFIALIAILLELKNTGGH